MASVRDDEFLRLAAASGCKALFLGLESVSQTSLVGAQKGHNQVAAYKELLKRFHDHGIAVQSGIMFGFDGDTKDIFARTVDAMGEIGLDNATVSLMVPYPGSRGHACRARSGPERYPHLTTLKYGQSTGQGNKRTFGALNDLCLGSG